MEKCFSTFYVASQAKGANQDSFFNTYGHDCQLIIEKGMGGGDH